jgi:hypothetical protein
LRAAIAAAGSGDSIVFAPSVHLIRLTSGELGITTSLNIDGPGPGQLTISGNNTSRVFAVSPGTTVTLAGLTVANGMAASGGGIDNAGNLTVAYCTVSNNESLGGPGGGGILNEVGATLVLDHAVVSHNQAITSVGSDVLGGGLWNLGSAVVANSTFAGDQALGGGSGTFYGGSVGGAIASSHGARLSVSSSRFTDNEAISAAGPYFASGGAVESDAGVNNDQPSFAVITYSTFTNNLVAGGDGVTGNGGGIDNQGPGVTMTVSNCTLAGNESIGGNNGNGTNAFGEGLGGGMMNLFGTLTVSNCTLVNNQALGGNGGTAGLTNPPTGSGQGGGIVNLEGTLWADDCTLSGNRAVGGNTAAGSGGIGDAGGIANWGAGLGGGLPGTAYLTDCTVTGNEAVAGSGGSSFPAAFAVGGGIDNSFSGIMYVTHCTVSNNQAVGSNGAAGANGGLGEGGGIEVGFSVLLGLVDNSVLQVTTSTIRANTAQGGGGGAGGNGGDGLGGGLAISAGSSATVSDSTVENNLALGGAAGSGGSAGHGVGGGVHNDGTFMFDALTLIKKNHASTSNDDIFP